MLKKKKGFVDKGLYGLKDRLKSTSETPDSTEIIPDSIQENVQEKQTNLVSKQTDSPQKQEETVRVTENMPPHAKNKNIHKIEQKKTDIELLKALQKRKEEYLRTKKHVIDKSESVLNNIPYLTSDLKRKFDEISKAEQAIKTTLQELYLIDEKQWKSEDFSTELGIALKTTENARLQYLMLTNKLTELDNSENNNIPAKDTSIIPELTSLKFLQFFKMGFGLFLPLILGLILTAAIISITIFFVMGGF